MYEGKNCRYRFEQIFAVEKLLSRKTRANDLTSLFYNTETKINV